MNAAAKFKTAMTAQRAAMDTLSDGLESVRREIAALHEEHEDVSMMPPPIETALKRVDEYVALLQRPLESASAMEFMVAEEYRPPALLYNVDHFAVALGAEQYGKHLKKRLREAYADQPGISDADRQKELARIDADLMAAELVEESLIRNAERAGITLQRRRDANPAAVLAADEALP